MQWRIHLLKPYKVIFLQAAKNPKLNLKKIKSQPSPLPRIKIMLPKDENCEQKSLRLASFKD